MTCDYVVFPVTVTLVSCKYTETLEKGRGNPVYLGLKEPELCLFCTKVKGQPTLQLQVSMENKGLVYAWLGVKVKVLVAQLCPTLSPQTVALPGSSVHGVFQARILEWVAIPFSRGSSQPRNQTQVSHIAGRCFTF